MIKIKIPKKIKKVFTKRHVLTVLGTVFLLALLYFGKSLVFAAWVGKTPIFRISLIRELEKQGGNQVLENLIDKALILQEAKRLKTKVTEDEVNAALKSIEDSVKAQGLTLEDALKFSNQTKEQFIEQLRFQKVIEKILTPKITVSDDEVKEFFLKNKELYNKNANFESLKEQIKNQVLQTKISDEYEKWLEELRLKAKILYF